MKESQVMDILKEVTENDFLTMDEESQWDSLRQMEILHLLSKADDRVNDIRNLYTAMTPRKIINILKENKII
jgi:acyl carrier protein